MAALEDFQRLYADDPAAVLQSIDYHFMKGDTAKALKAVDKLDDVIGGDPMLRLISAGVLISENKYVEAQQRDHVRVVGRGVLIGSGRHRQGGGLG